MCTRCSSRIMHKLLDDFNEIWMTLNRPKKKPFNFDADSHDGAHRRILILGGGLLQKSDFERSASLLVKHMLYGI